MTITDSECSPDLWFELHTGSVFTRTQFELWMLQHGAEPHAVASG